MYQLPHFLINTHCSEVMNSVYIHYRLLDTPGRCQAHAHRVLLF